MRLGLFLTVILVVFSAPSWAQENLSDPSFGVIAQQLEAVRKRDSQTVFSLIAPSLQQKFVDSKAYFRKIRFKNHVLYAHISAKLIGTEKSDPYVLHRVELTNKEGQKSIALFRVISDEKGQWRVASTVMLGDKDQNI